MPHSSPTGPREGETAGTEPGEEFDPAASVPARSGHATAPRLLWIPAVLLGGYIVYTAGYLGARHQRTPPPVAAVAGTELRSVGVKVFVTGRVRRPGVYALSSEARVEDAIKMAGGALPGADTGALNLAEWVTDGGKIVVPARLAKRQPGAGPAAGALHSGAAPATGPDRYSPALPRPITSAQANLEANEAAPRRRRARRKTVPGDPNSTSVRPLTGSQSQKPAGGSRSPVAAFPTPQPTPTPLLPLNLNTATQNDLEFLPGIGPKMAAAILEQRAAQGGFGSVEDLTRIKGMGPKKLARLRPYLFVPGAP